ncbi:HAD hydrolase-like protein [Streptomyces sp. NPDC050287]|uniref:HAD hydrolase-like protein n=1 Tax=Streptomyces sp. NPDC050287 TaxID=3365608 RepID=UPI0037B44EC6
MDGGAHGWTRCAPGGCGPPHRAVRPVAGAREAVGLLRLHGISTGFVTEQPGVARGVLTDAEGPLSTGGSTTCSARSTVGVCPHAPADGCHCRPPEPGLILWAVGGVCTAPSDCVVVSDLGAHVEAARRAGGLGILVSSDRTRPEETAWADHVAPDVLPAVRAVLNGPPQGRVLVDERLIEDVFDTGPRPR